MVERRRPRHRLLNRFVEVCGHTGDIESRHTGAGVQTASAAETVVNGSLIRGCVISWSRGADARNTVAESFIQAALRVREIDRRPCKQNEGGDFREAPQGVEHQTSIREVDDS
jgi:hypothetical protein